MRQTRCVTYPCSYSQTALWLAQRLEPDGPERTATNSAVGLYLRGPLDRDALAGALADLVSRHELLRTTFHEVDGEPRQEIYDHAHLDLEDADRTDVEGLIRAPFDLATGPLLRAHLVRTTTEDEHLLLLVAHHLVVDGWSWQNVLAELRNRYAQRDTPALTHQYRHYVEWQRARIDPAERAWKDALKGRPDAVLPCVPHPPGGQRRGAKLDATVPAADLTELRTAAKPLRTTPYHLLLTGFVAALSRYTSTDDVTVGALVAGRTRPEWEPLIGDFVNVVPIRAGLTPADTFRTAVAKVRAAALHAQAHQDIPYERLTTAGDPPLRYTCMVQPPPTAPPDWPGLATGPWYPDLDDVMFELSVVGTTTQAGLELRVEYRADLLDHSTVRRFADHLVALLAAMAGTPDRPLDDLPLLSAAEHHRAVHEWNPPPVPPAPPVFDAIAAQPAGAVAVIDGDTTLTYGELLDRALAARPLGPVAVGPRSADAVVTLVAALAARVPFILGGTGSGPPGIDDLSYVVHTSGSTGVPKPVAVTRANLASTARAWRDVFDLARRPPRLLQVADPAFDVFVGDVVRALCNGGSLVLCPREVLLDPAQLYALMVGRKVTAADLVPVVARQLATHLAGTGQRLDFLDLLVVGSDRVDIGDFRDLVALCGPHTRVVNAYGLTEATIDSTVYVGPVPTGTASAPMPIGRPLPGTTAYVLDRRLRPCPIGVTGELYVGGAGVTRGYPGDPVLTAQRFLPDPYRPGERLYRTGDLARYHPDGVLDVLGRADDQVKVRGRRIEPAGVAAAIRALPGAGECAVVARPDAYGEPHLVAYLTGPADPHALRALLAARLPEHEVPDAFVRLPALPLTASGKVDAAALPPPTAPARRYVAPTEPAQVRLAEIWCGLLGVPRVGRYDSFVALGGHSMLAARLVAQVRAAFGVELPLRAVFEHPTLAALAQVVTDLLVAEIAALSDEEAAALLDRPP
jgi:amino acid adenylation domain-containing protein